MIKFFRKIRQNLLSEGKIGKPALPAGRYLKYAIGEIILVVIGILIALSINNWNENRKDRNEELVALKDLKEEFQSNLKDVESQLSYKGEISDLWDEYLNKISNTQLNDDERTKKRPRMGSRLFAISNSTLNSLLNTGKIDKIKNDSLKYLLSNWNDILNLERKDELLQYEFVQNIFIKFELKLLPNSALRGISGTKNFFHNEEEIKKMRLIAINNLEYQNALEYNFHLLKLQLESGKRLKTKIASIIDLLSDEISRR